MSETEAPQPNEPPGGDDATDADGGPAGGEGRPRLRSLLGPRLKGWLALALALAALMLADTVYLLVTRLASAVGPRALAISEVAIPPLYQLALLAHTGVGLALAAVMVVFLVAHLPIVWKRRHRASVVSGVTYAALGLTLALTGLFILTAAASAENRWAWWAHVIAAGLVPMAYVAHRVVSYARPPARRYGRFAGAVVGLAAILAAGHAVSRAGVAEGPAPVTATAQPVDDGSTFVPAGYVSPLSPYFPSAARTQTNADVSIQALVPEVDDAQRDRVRAEVQDRGFAVEERVGAGRCERCHADVTAQWQSSAHRFASFNNPFYGATITDMRENALEPNPWIAQHLDSRSDVAGVGVAKSKWCGGCHDPALLLTGVMGRGVDPVDVEAQAGLTCLACHAIGSIHDRTGNGNYGLEDAREDPYVFADAGEGTLSRFLHDAAIRARPQVHKEQMLKPFFTESEFCATCHKVSLRAPVNNYRWLRGQNEFDAWDDSGVALNAARTFYLPPARRVCQDCHMPLEPATQGDFAATNGMIRSHRFLAVNTALPFIRQDDETIERIEAFLRDDKMRVDVFAARVEGRSDPVFDLVRTRPVLPAGATVTFDVVVRNLGVGHTFPGGTNDSNEGWIEFTLTGEDGRTLAVSGALGADGRLDPTAHVFKALILDRDGNPIHRRNAQDIHVVVFANVVGPGTADLAHYRVTIPPELAGTELTARARLLWRKFDRDYTEFAYRANPAGFARFGEVPDLPVSEIAADTVRVRVGAPGEDAGSAAAAPDPDRWMFMNDYGIGALLERDTRAAALAFAEVERAKPELIDGPLNLARTALADGDIDGAYAALRRVERVRSGDARAAWVWGQVLQEDGRYAEAVLAYDRVLEEFPNDRATWRARGRTLFLDQQYEDALASFARVLQIDPEDRVAHYHRMLSLRALGRDEEARVAETAYLYYAIDESAQEITRAYRARDPGANLMTQAIRTHDLEIRP